MRIRMSLAAFIVLCGCGGTSTPVQYAQPMRVHDSPPPIVRLDDVSPPFQRNISDVVDHDVLREQPPANGAKDKDPHAVISEARAEADTAPEDGDATGTTMVYVYDRDISYRVYGCYKEPVDLMFAAGEQVVESLGHDEDGEKAKAPAGRRLVKGWDYGFTSSGDGIGHIVQVMTLKPITEDTTVRRLVIHTSVGPYTLLLEVLPRDETRCMDRVRWRHPKRELQMLIDEGHQRDEVSARAAAGDNCVSANYEIEVREGSPRWVPTLVWRTCDGDHARVHIQFRGDVAWSKIPSLMSDGGVVDYRYIPEDHVMVVDGLFTRGLLSLGSKGQGYERVSIKALKEPR